MAEKQKKQSPLTREDFQTGVQSIQDELAKVNHAIRQELADSTKKLHMEVIGTQNDLLKFKDEIVHQLLKTQMEAHEAIKNMMTKEGAQRIVERLYNTEQALQKSIQETAKKEDIKKILDTIDAFAQRIETYDRKAPVHDHRLTENEIKLQDHETRIIHLETTVQK